MDYDLWLGPAQETPFVTGVHPANWRKYWDFGTGTLGDMGCHMLDVPFYELELGAPISAKCIPVKASTDQFPESESVVVKYAPNRMTSKDGLTLHWFDGGQFPDFKALGLPEGWEGGEQGKKLLGFHA